jgi:hypothetical protein
MSFFWGMLGGAVSTLLIYAIKESQDKDEAERFRDRLHAARMQVDQIHQLEILVNAYPREFVVASEGKLVIHTADQTEAWTAWVEAWKHAREEPIIVPPKLYRRHVEAVILRGHITFPAT